MDRRRFLKYAGATAAVVGASALGLSYLTEQSPSITSQTSSTTLTPRLSTVSSISSSESVQLASLHGRLFFDYNGNGIHDGDEPSAQNARVQIQDNNTQVIAEVLTDSSGDYKVDIPPGNYKLFVQTDMSKPDNPNFRYMCRSPSEFRAITDGYDLSVVGDGRFDVGLMEGFLTLPFESRPNYAVANWYDWDPAQATYLWWNEQSELESDRLHSSRNHIGIDYEMEIGSDVIAPAPGVIYGSQQLGPQGQIGLLVYHSDITVNGINGRFNSFFNHLSKVLKSDGEVVSRGEKFAESGMTGTFFPHLHYNNSFGRGSDMHYLDFYEPAFPLYPNHGGYWVGQDSWKNVSASNNPNGQNFWTRLNKPVFFQ